MSNRINLCLSIVAVLAMVLTSNAMAQPGGGGPGGGRGGMFGGGGQSSLFLLMNEKVQEELQLVDDQIEDLKGIQDEAQTAMRELFADMRNNGGGTQDRQAMFEEMRTKMEERTKDFEADVKEILLPEQMKRLEQLQVQMQSRGRGGSGTGLLDNEELKKKLGITAEQEEKMREAAEKAQEMVREESQKLQKKAMDQVLSILSSDQRKQYEELTGDSFDFGGGFGRGGGPGGPGGGRGAQGGGRGGQGGGRGGQGGGGAQTDF